MAEILNETYSGVTVSSDFIMHYGAKGQKWGLRRWQNEDGSLTPAGRVHYGVGQGKGQKKFLTKEDKAKLRAERKEAKAQRKAERAEEMAAKKEEKSAEREAKKAEDLENKKQKIIANADPETIIKNKNILSTAEFNEAYNRAMLTKKTSDLIVPKQSKLDKFISIGTKVSDTMKMINNVKEQRDKLFGLDEKKKLALEIAKETRQEQRDIAKENRQEERELRKEKRKKAEEAAKAKAEQKEKAKAEKEKQQADGPQTIDRTSWFDSERHQEHNNVTPDTRWTTKADRKADARQWERISSMTSLSSSNPSTVSLDKPISVVQRLSNTTFKDAGSKKVVRSLYEGRDYESFFSTPVKSLSATWAPEPTEEEKRKKKRNSDLSFLKLYGM